MKTYRKLNKKNKTKKNKTRRRRGGTGGITTYRCPRCNSYDIECDSETDICKCNCGAIAPSKCFHGDPKVFGYWAQNEGPKWLKDRGYSDIILR